MVASNTAERRRSARFLPAFATYCYSPSGGEGLVWDISTTGLGMLVAAALEPGAEMPMELSSGATGLAVTARVAHVRQLQGGDYFVGLRFDRPLARHELEPFITPPPDAFAS